MSKYPLLEKTAWEHPKHYMGETYEDYYELLGRSRDSDILEESNFESALDLLGGESKYVIVARASHWAVGWVESLMLHQDAPDKYKEIAEKILKDLYTEHLKLYFYDKKRHEYLLAHHDPSGKGIWVTRKYINQTSENYLNMLEHTLNEEEYNVTDKIDEYGYRLFV